MSQKVATVERDVLIRTDVLAELFTTEHDGATILTGRHTRDFDTSIGGWRFNPAGSREEVADLASAMTYKCAAAMLPADGQKSTAIPSGSVPPESDRVRLLIDHARAVLAHDEGLLFGPDMFVGETVQDAIFAEPDLHNHVTGLSEQHGGLGIDTNGYTAYGVVAAIDQCRARGLGDLDGVIIQGFGAVGSWAARKLPAMGIQVRGISTAVGAVFARDGGYLDAEQLFEMRRIYGDAVPEYYASAHPDSDFDRDPDALFRVRADVFIPAAFTRVLADEAEFEEARQQNSRVHGVEKFYEETKVRVIAEAANHPLGEGAEAYLEARDVVVLPDYLINCGGLIGCYLEWAFRDEILASPDARLRIDRRARAHTDRAVRGNIDGILDAKKGAREAARRIADQNRQALLERIAPLRTRATGREIARLYLGGLDSA